MALRREGGGMEWRILSSKDTAAKSLGAGRWPPDKELSRLKPPLSRPMFAWGSQWLSFGNMKETKELFYNVTAHPLFIGDRGKCQS